MNTLPKMLHLFQCVPIENPDQYFAERNKIFSRFIWAGKKPTVKCKTLQLPKDKGELGLLCLHDYYMATQIKPVVGWCKPGYRSRWKEIEYSLGGNLPVRALIGDPSMSSCLRDPGNPWIISLMKTWNGLLKKYQLKQGAGPPRWVTYKFLLSKTDSTFKTWANNRIE